MFWVNDRKWVQESNLSGPGSWRCFSEDHCSEPQVCSPCRFSWLQGSRLQPDSSSSSSVDQRKKKTLSKHFNYLLLLLSKNSFITAKGNMTETGGLEHENRIWALAPSRVLFRKLQVRKRLIFTWLYRLYCRLKKVTCSKHTNIKSRVLTRHVFSYFWDNVELIFWLTLQPNVDIRQSNL